MTGTISSYFVGVPGGLIMSFIAFSIVFIVIVGLMLVMMGMKHVCSAIDNMGKPKPKPATSAQPLPAPTPAASAVAVSADDDELLAVISAAIMATCGKTARVVTFSPVKAPAPTSWKNVGRLQNTESC